MSKYLICLVMALLTAACAPISAARALSPSVSAKGQEVAQAKPRAAPHPIDPRLAD